MNLFKNIAGFGHYKPFSEIFQVEQEKLLNEHDTELAKDIAKTNAAADEDSCACVTDDEKCGDCTDKTPLGMLTEERKTLQEQFDEAWNSARETALKRAVRLGLGEENPVANETPYTDVFDDKPLPEPRDYPTGTLDRRAGYKMETNAAEKAAEVLDANAPVNFDTSLFPVLRDSSPCTCGPSEECSKCLPYDEEEAKRSIQEARLSVKEAMANADLSALDEVLPDTNPKTRFGIAKPSMAVVSPDALIHLMLAMQNGANKYGPFNWREHSVSAKIYYDAIMRHLMAWYMGEEIAEDSGVHHLGHAMAGLNILLDAMENGNLIDDRPPAGRFAELVKKYTKPMK